MFWGEEKLDTNQPVKNVWNRSIEWMEESNIAKTDYNLNGTVYPINNI